MFRNYWDDIMIVLCGTKFILHNILLPITSFGEHISDYRKTNPAKNSTKDKECRKSVGKRVLRRRQEESP